MRVSVHCCVSAQEFEHVVFEKDAKMDDMDVHFDRGTTSDVA